MGFEPGQREPLDIHCVMKLGCGDEQKISLITERRVNSKERAHQGFQPGTTLTQNQNYTPRPSSQSPHQAGLPQGTFVSVHFHLHNRHNIDKTRHPRKFYFPFRYGSKLRSPHQPFQFSGIGARYSYFLLLSLEIKVTWLSTGFITQLGLRGETGVP